MSYMRTNPANPANIPPSAVSAVRRDQMYFREISSPDVRRLYEAIDEVLDPMEYEGSLLFDEYPDTGEISRLAERVLRGAREQKNLLASDFDAKGRDSLLTSDFDAQGEDPVRERDLAKALLCEEMCRRRFRHLLLSIS